MDESELMPYEDEQQRLSDVARLILPLESKLRRLPKDHIEQLVIWLKNIHNPSDPEDRNVDVLRHFYNKVAELKNIPEQIYLQNQAVKAVRSAIYTGMLIGGLVIVALWGVGAGWYVSLVLLVAVPYLWRKALQFSLKSMLVSKEQEQKNVWRAIREAKNVPQLQNAGLYAYINNNDFDNVTQHMRDAIYCNGEDGYSFAKHMEELKAGLAL
jgi:hypothetical protein